MTEEGEAMTFLANGLYTTASLQFLLALSGACYPWIGYARNITNLESVHLHSTNLVDAEAAIPFVANLCRGSGNGSGSSSGGGSGLGSGLGNGLGNDSGTGLGLAISSGLGTGCGHGTGTGTGSGAGLGLGNGSGTGSGSGSGNDNGIGYGHGIVRGTDVEIFIETLGWVGHVEAKQALVKLYEDLTRV